MRASLGFWRSWAVSAGTMIGSGIFVLPAVLAPYGHLGLAGWMLAAVAALCTALCLAGLAARQPALGGPYAWVRDGFGRLPGFLTAWGYWVSIWVALAAVATGFAGYLARMQPTLAGYEPLVALSVLWLACGVNLLGVRTSGALLLVLTVLRILPLLLVGVLGLSMGERVNMAPSVGPEVPLVVIAASVAVLVMWAFAGLEAASIPAEDTRDPGRTIPRALVVAVLSAAAVYVLATTGVQMLLPADTLAASNSPFADAAAVVTGSSGALLVGLGALVAMGGGLNANMLLAGQMPLAAARDGLFPARFAQRSAQGVSTTALLVSTGLASLVLLANYSRTLVAAYTTMILVSTLMLLLPYVGSALVVLRGGGGWRRLLPALGSLAAAALFIAGTGWAELLAGAVLLLLGVLLFHLQQRREVPT